MDIAISSAGFFLLACAVFLLARPFDRRILSRFALLAAVYLAADDLVTGLPNLVPAMDLVGDDWNWMGKILSLALSVLVIACLRLSPTAVGLTWTQRHPKIGVIAVMAFIVWGACLGLLFEPGMPDAETLAFQATMPGLAEELVYRGVLPALLLGLVRHRPMGNGIPWAVVVATSVMFGAWHGLSYSNGSFGFDVMSALFPFIGSIPGAWLRFKTGSLVVPVLGHSLANVAFHLAGGFVA